MFPNRVIGGWRFVGTINGRYVNEFLSLKEAPTRNAAIEWRIQHFGSQLAGRIDPERKPEKEVSCTSFYLILWNKNTMAIHLLIIKLGD